MTLSQECLTNKLIEKSKHEDVISLQILFVYFLTLPSLLILQIVFFILVHYYLILMKEGPLRNIGPPPTLGSTSCKGLVFT